MADDGARAGAARRRRPRRARGGRERQPPAARRGARARAGRGRPGRAQPVRRPRAPWRGARALRRGRDCPDRAFAAGRAAARRVGSPGTRRWRRSPRHAARRRRRSRSRGCSASRPPSSRFPARGGRRPRARPRRAAASSSTRTSERPSPGRSAARVRLAASSCERRRGRPGHGHPGRRARAASPRTTSPAGTSASTATSVAARCASSPSALDEALARGRPADRPRQHLPDARRAEPRDRGGGPPRSRRRGASGSTRRWRRRRSTSSSGCSTASARCPTPEELRRLARREPGLLAPTSQMRALRELEPPSTDEGFAAVEHVAFARAPRDRAGRGVRRRAGVERPGLGGGGRTGRPGGAAPRVRLEPRAERPRRSLPIATRLAAVVSGPVETALCAAPAAARRPAGAGRRFPDCRSRSRGRTESTRPARPWSAQAPRTGRSRTRSARGSRSSVRAGGALQRARPRRHGRRRLRAGTRCRRAATGAGGDRW